MGCLAGARASPFFAPPVAVIVVSLRSHVVARPIDALHTHQEKSDYWKDRLQDFLTDRPPGQRVALVADDDSQTMVGYILGEIRAFEFGSQPCGWIFAVGVEPDKRRFGIASLLLSEACRCFRQAGVSTIRTMVRGDNVPVLSFFRSKRFIGGPFVQLELEEVPA